MKEAKFGKVWDIIIKPFLENTLNKHKSLYSVDSTDNNSQSRRDIESWYNSLRAMVKADFMKNGNKLLDRHKISACFYIAVAEVAPIKTFGGSLDKDRLINAYLAFYVASGILLSFMCNGSKDAAYSQFLKSEGLQYPVCKNSDSTEPYVIQTVKGLAHAHKRNGLNVLALANVFRLLENNTELVYQA